MELHLIDYLSCSLFKKRCVRLLFGTKPTFDNNGFYQTCARAKTYPEHMAKKNYSLENTKPIFNREKILSIHNLYVHHVFIELFKILKNRQPISLVNLFQLSLRSSSFIIRTPQFKLDLSKHNFVHVASTTWNSLISKVIDKCKPNECNVILVLVASLIYRRRYQ